MFYPYPSVRHCLTFLLYSTFLKWVENPFAGFVWWCPSPTPDHSIVATPASAPSTHTSVLDSLPGCPTHACARTHIHTRWMLTVDKRASSPVDWSRRPFVLTLFFTRRIKSYKGFLLHTLLANCIKAFGGSCLSRAVCTSIKSGEPLTRRNLCQIPSLWQRATQEAGRAGESDTGICSCVYFFTNPPWQGQYDFGVALPAAV